MAISQWMSVLNFLDGKWQKLKVYEQFSCLACIYIRNGHKKPLRPDNLINILKGEELRSRLPKTKTKKQTHVTGETDRAYINPEKLRHSLLNQIYTKRIWFEDQQPISYWDLASQDCKIWNIFSCTVKQTENKIKSWRPFMMVFFSFKSVIFFSGATCKKSVLFCRRLLCMLICKISFARLGIITSHSLSLLSYVITGNWIKNLPCKNTLEN